MRRWLALAALAIGAAGANAQNTFPAQAVGSASGAQAVVVKSAAGGTVVSAEVLTAGNPAGDFAADAGSSNCAGAALAAGGSCTESVTFTPSAPGLHMGAVVLLDANHRVLGATYISGTGLGGLGVLVPGNVITIAGTPGVYTGLGDNGQATAASLNLPSSITFDGQGNMYIADSLHNRIRMVCSTTATVDTSCSSPGVISTIAGNDTPGYTGDGGPASAATLDMPNSVAVDGAGNLYIADTGNNVIRMISAATGNISTVAGGAAAVCAGSTDPVGDGCPATQATLNAPWGVTLDAAGNIYIADTFNQRIREVSSTTGVITTIAGTGYTQADGSGGYNGDNILATAAELNLPFAVAFDPRGNMYIPDSGNQRVREVKAVNGGITAASTIVTYAGTGTEGATYGCYAAATPAGQVPLSWPEGVAVDAAGNVYIADTQNESILKVNAATVNLTTLIQNGCGADYVDGQFAPVDLYGPMGLYVDGSGNVYVADYYDMVIREVQSNYAAINDYNPLNPTQQGTRSGATLQEVENDGNAPLDLTSLTAGTNTAIDTTVTEACTTGSLAADADCNIGAEFAPATTPVLLYPENEDGTITADEDTQPSLPAPNNPLDVEVFGTAGPGYGTVTSITSTPNPSVYLQNVTFTVSVTSGKETPSGIVTIADTYNGATTTLGAVSLTASYGTTATGTFSITTLGVGKHSIVASYDGDTVHSPSQSTDNGVPPLIQTVEAGSITTLTSNLNPSTLGAPVTFTAVVVSSPAGSTPTGTVTFMDGTTTLGSVTLTTVAKAQQATFTSTALPNGPNAITAVYSGDTAIQGSTSNGITQDVQAPATLIVTSSLNPSYQGNNVVFSATISSKATQPATGTVIFLNDGVQIGTGTLSGNPGTAKFATATLPLGTNPITATYAGDPYNTAAQTQGPLNQVVTLEAFSLSVNPAALTLKSSTNGTLTVTVTSVGGYSDTISFGCSSLPAKVNCDFSPVAVKLPANGSATAHLNIDTNNPLQGGTSASNRGMVRARLAGIFLPFGLIFGCLFRRQRRRSFGLLTVVLAVMVSAATLSATGCSGLSLNSAAPGTYTIQVSGTAATSYFTRSQKVKLTITQ